MTIRRFTRYLTASLESFFDDIQDHEADMDATIREVERGSGRVRAQRVLAERRLRQLEAAQASAQAELTAWRERALPLRADRERALACLRRARLARQSADSAARAHVLQLALFEQLCSDERTVEGKLSELERQRASLISREARAALAHVAGGDAGWALERSCDRWQARIEEHEAFAESSGLLRDDLACSLDAEEERRELEQELATLLASEVGR